MIEKIREILKRIGIETYLITEEKVQTVELFFIRKELDMRRMKDVKKYVVTVYQDFIKEHQKMRGAATAYLYSSMNEDEIQQILEDAYFASSFADNPYYDLPKGKKEEKIYMENQLAHQSLEESSRLMAQALFKEDCRADVFINSAELFVSQIDVHIVSSEGSDVAYRSYTVQGEFISQCLMLQDVEQYENFYYEDLCIEELEQKVKAVLENTLARSSAKPTPKIEDVKVILSGSQVKTLLSYYVEKSDAAMIYPQYSNYKIGEAVQGDCITGEKLDIILKADIPYTEEGIRKTDHILMEKGILKNIHGSSQMAAYLGIEPIGTFTGIKLEGGSKCLEDMKEGAYLHIVSFSDFQMDAMTGYFGGEIRLAFYCDGKQTIPVTGGSLNGRIQDNQETFCLSKEKYIEKGYEGPLAICLEHVTIAS